MTAYNVYNSNYHGKTYSVKYLGIVDGTMGILSRKMALQAADAAAVTIPNKPVPESPSQHIISEDQFTDVRVVSNPAGSVTKSSEQMSPGGTKNSETPSKVDVPIPFAPVLGKKNYT